MSITNPISVETADGTVTETTLLDLAQSFDINLDLTIDLSEMLDTIFSAEAAWEVVVIMGEDWEAWAEDFSAGWHEGYGCED